jgi:hypothetical protein
MIKLLVSVQKIDANSQCENETYVSIKANIPELEALLSKSGFSCGDGSILVYRLVSAEVDKKH